MGSEGLSDCSAALHKTRCHLLPLQQATHQHYSINNTQCFVLSSGDRELKDVKNVVYFFLR